MIDDLKKAYSSYQQALYYMPNPQVSFLTCSTCAWLDPIGGPGSSESRIPFSVKKADSRSLRANSRVLFIIRVMSTFVPNSRNQNCGMASASCTIDMEVSNTQRRRSRA